MLPLVTEPEKLLSVNVYVTTTFSPVASDFVPSTTSQSAAVLASSTVIVPFVKEGFVTVVSLAVTLTKAGSAPSFVIVNLYVI